MANKTIHQLTPIESLDLSSTVEFAVYDAGNNSTNKLDLLNINLPQLGTNNKTIPSAINELKSNNDQLQESITEITDGIGNIGQFGDRITSLENSVGGISSTVSIINNSIGRIQNNIEGINTKIGNVPSNSSIMRQIDSHNSQISSNTTEINKNKTDISNLNNQITTITPVINNLNSASTYSYVNSTYNLHISAIQHGKNVSIDIQTPDDSTKLKTNIGTGTGYYQIAQLPEQMHPKRSIYIKGMVNSRKFGTLYITNSGQIKIGYTYVITSNTSQDNKIDLIQGQSVMMVNLTYLIS